MTIVPQLHRLCSTHAISSCYTLIVARNSELEHDTKQNQIAEVSVYSKKLIFPSDMSANL